MVNKKTERTFASEDGESAEVKQIDEWLENTRKSFGVLLEGSGDTNDLRQKVLEF